MGPRTDEDTISLLRRLATLYPDEVIAGILNRQERKKATGEPFTANPVGSLRRYRDIPRFQAPTPPTDGDLVSIRKAAQILGMNTSSIHRWLDDGFIAGEQVTPGSPILDLLAAKYSFINEPLAKLYGIPGVTGEEFRRVDLHGTPRIGILTQASVLTV